MSRGHAKLSPSGADRWMACPGSVKLEEGLPDDSSRYAEEGTAAHELGEACLLKEKPARAFLNHMFNNYEVTPEMANHVQEYVDRVKERPGHRYVEKCVEVDGLPVWGTADCVTVDPAENTAYGDDLKYGKGVRVPATTRQLKIYALGILHEFEALCDINTVVVRVIQPRLDHVEEATYTREELERFYLELSDAAEATEAENPKLVPGKKQCKFCKAKATCPALRGTVTQAFPDMTNEVNLPLADAKAKKEAKNAVKGRVGDTLPADVAALLDIIPLVRMWADAVEGHALQGLLRGEAVPGYKMVAGKRSRKWGDPDAAQKKIADMTAGGKRLFLIDDYAPRSFISAPKTEKLIGKDRYKRIEKFVEWNEGSKVMVPNEDNRTELQPDNVFPDEAGDDTDPFS